MSAKKKEKRARVELVRVKKYIYIEKIKLKE